jgi:DNA-binding transcriptional ArsR family regulator
MSSTINFLRLLADPTRLRLLLLLEQEELSVAELQQILGMGQSRISSHLAQLKRAGVVEDRRAGKNVYYGASENGQGSRRARVAELSRTLARELPETSRDRTSLKLVLRRGKIWPEVLPGAIVAGSGPRSDNAAATARRGGPWRRRGNALAVASQNRAQSYRN